ncbi:MAG: response regulator [Chloroflexi bacterium]|nr:response regulator [Chloroflexota bacterium]
MVDLICFIDDDDRFEIPLFTQTFGDDFDLIAGTSLEACRQAIVRRADRMPGLFVLDLYFPCGLPDEKVMEELAAHPIELPNDRADLRQAYMNFLAARDRLNKVLSARKQGPQGGLQLAAEVHGRYPNIPIVFYSRKATAEDVLRCMQQDGVVDVITKPTGRDDEDTVHLTLKMKGAIASRFLVALDPGNRQRMAEVRKAVGLIMEGVNFFNPV